MNIPTFVSGEGKTLPYLITHMGIATSFTPAFYEDLRQNPLAAASGIPAGLGLSGIGLVSGGSTLPTGTTAPIDDSPTSEGNVIAAGTGVAVSPVVGVAEADQRDVARLQRVIKQLSH